MHQQRLAGSGDRGEPVTRLPFASEATFEVGDVAHGLRCAPLPGSPMAKLFFYYSAMNAGKTTTLLQSAHNYHERGMRTLSK